MKLLMTDMKLDGAFPLPPIKGSNLLVPITTWVEMFHETQITGVEFDEFWYEKVEEGVAYFFKWHGKPRATVLVVWDEEGPTHIECRTLGDLFISEIEGVSIRAEVVKLFCNAGFWSGKSINYTNGYMNKSCSGLHKRKTYDKTQQRLYN